MDRKAADLLEAAWVIISNAGIPAGDWESLSPQWHEAAIRWRNQYFDWCTKQNATGSSPSGPRTAGRRTAPRPKPG